MRNRCHLYNTTFQSLVQILALPCMCVTLCESLWAPCLYSRLQWCLRPTAVVSEMLAWCTCTDLSVNLGRFQTKHLTKRYIFMHFCCIRSYPWEGTQFTKVNTATRQWIAAHRSHSQGGGLWQRLVNVSLGALSGHSSVSFFPFFLPSFLQSTPLPRAGWVTDAGDTWGLEIGFRHVLR